MKLNTIYNEDCRKTISNLSEHCVDVVLTSPFYNTNMKAKGGRTIFDGKTGNEYARYDKFIDVMSNDEYRDFTVNLFKGYDKILKENGVVLYNISYGNENSECMFLAVSDILTKTDFTIGDVIIWKRRALSLHASAPTSLHVSQSMSLCFVGKRNT